MKLYIKRSCLSFIVLSALIKAIQSSENDTNETRQGRVNGRIVKLYSGTKPDPVMCQNEGFKADPLDCSVFYRCVHSFRGKFNVFRFQCGPGTVYDLETEVCNYPSNTKRSECNGATALSNLEIDGNDINFLEMPSPITTTSELNNINDTGSSIAFPEKVLDKVDSTTNINGLVITTTVSQQLSGAYDISGIYSWENKNDRFTKVPLHSTKPPGIEQYDPCTVDGFVGDSYDCKKFYRCVSNFRGGFTRHEFVCSDATVWDEVKQSCNYAWAVRSKRCGRDATSNNIENISYTLGIDKVKTTSNYNDLTAYNQNDNIVMEKIPNENHFGERFNNGYNSYNNPISTIVDQSKQYTTSTYTSYQSANMMTDKNLVSTHVSETPPNYQISEETENQKQDEEIIKDTSMSIIVPRSTENILLMSSIIDSVKLLNNICTQSGFIGDPNDCQKFYRCVDNGQGTFKKYDFSCSQGTVWDREIEACNHAWAVKGCSNKAFNQSLSVESSGINGISSENNSESEDTNNIDIDYVYSNQINGDGIKTTTSKIETTFSLPSSSEDTNIKNSCSSSGFFVNSVDCSKFYRCVENGNGFYTRYDYNCGEGTLWDETIEACNHAWAVKSCKSSSEGSSDTGFMTTITLVQTTTQENIDDNNYDSSYSSQQSTTTSSTVIEVSATTFKQTMHANGSECSTDGFIGDNSDCKKFYRCVDNGHGGYTRYEFSCGDGTVWDPTIEACNYGSEVKDITNSCNNNNNSNNVETATSTENIETGYETSNNQDLNKPVHSTLVHSTTSIAPSDNNKCEYIGFMGDSDDCDKFYRCIDNGKGGYDRIEFKCGEGTVWDSSIEACNHRWAVEKCGKDSNNEFSQTTSNAMVTDSSTSFVPTKSPEYLDSSNQHTSTETSSGSEDLCLSEGFFGSSKGDCNKFYRCVDNGEGGFTKYDFKCGDGTIWDDNIKACNHASDNNTCRNSSSKPQTETSSSTHGVEATTPVSTTTIQVPPHANENECTSEGFIGNPSDCQKFFRCVDDGKGGYTKFEFSCGEGTIWIQEIQACDHDTDGISCHRQNIMSTSSSTEIETTTNSTSSEDIENVVTSSSPSTQSSVENNINNNCTDEGFYPNKYDCQRFYRCEKDEKGSFTKYEFTCAEGTAWDTLIQSCNYIDQISSCKNNNISETEIKPESNNDTVTETQQNTTTLSPPPSTTTKKYSNENTCKEDGFFGDKEDCKKFYRCVSNDNKRFTKYDFNCGDGTIWDQDILACNYPNDVSNPSCRLDGTLSTMSSASTTTTASSNTEKSSPPPTTSKSSTPSSTAIDKATTKKDSNNSSCSDANSNNSCKQNYTCNKAGFYPDPNDCKKFYRCVDWESNGEKFSIYHFECGDGTIWDPALDTCNHEDAVYPPRNCNGKEQENQTNNTSSSTTEKFTTTLTETESTTSITETEPTSSTTPEKTTQTSTTTSLMTETKPTSTTIEKSTTQPSTTKSTTSQISTTQTSTTIMSTISESSTQQGSTTITLTTDESSIQQSTTTNSDLSTTESSSQTTTDITESTISASSTPNVYDTTTMITQISTTEPSSTTEITTSSEDISSQTTESQSSTDSTTVTNSQDSSTESSTPANKDCPDTEEDQYLYVCPTSFKRHPKYCNMFYQCTEDNDNHEVKVAVFNCPNNTIYDENKVQCVEEKHATKKCNGLISQRNRIKRLGADFNEPIVASEDSMRCLEAGHFPFEKREQCSPALLKCEYTKSGKLRGYVYKCPEGFLYWAISRRCEAIRKVRDCKLPSYNWKKRYDIPVERYNIGH